MPCKNYCRWLMSLLLCLCDIFHALINSLVSYVLLWFPAAQTPYLSLYRKLADLHCQHKWSKICLGCMALSLFFIIEKKLAGFFFFFFFLGPFFFTFLCPFVQFNFSFLYIINFHSFLLFFLPKNVHNYTDTENAKLFYLTDQTLLSFSLNSFKMPQNDALGFCRLTVFAHLKKNRSK